MQSLIHGNFEGTAQAKAYALVGRLGRDRRRDRAAARRLPDDLPFLARRVHARGRRHRRRPARQPAAAPRRSLHRRPGRRRRRLGPLGPRHGRPRARHPRLAGGRRVRGGAAGRSGWRRWGCWSTGCCAASAKASRPCSTRTCSRRSCSASGSPRGSSSRSPWAGMLIALPIYLQMVLGYNAMQAGLSLAPLSLTMFGVALVAGKRAGKAAARQPHPGRVRAAPGGDGAVDPDHPRRRQRLVPGGSARARRGRASACWSLSSTTTPWPRSPRNGSARRPASTPRPGPSASRWGWRSPARSCSPRSRSPSPARRRRARC